MFLTFPADPANFRFSNPPPKDVAEPASTIILSRNRCVNAMTSKNTKILVIASLIAVLAISISMTTFVQANNEQDTPPSPIVDDVTKNYVNDKFDEISAKKSMTEKDTQDLDKLQLIKDWIAATEAGNMTEARTIATQITADFPSDDKYTQAVVSDSNMNRG